MKPIDALMTEHRAIERSLDAVEAWVRRARDERRNDADTLKRFVAFVREVVDPLHHGKEETVLFATMIEHGFPREHGPIAVMLQEHERARQFMDVLSELASKPEWSPGDWDRIAQSVEAYATLMRQHVRKEDTVLYPMAEARLPPVIMDRIERAFEQLDRQHESSGQAGVVSAAASLCEPRGDASGLPAASAAP